MILETSTVRWRPLPFDPSSKHISPGDRSYTTIPAYLLVSADVGCYPAYGTWTSVSVPTKDGVQTDRRSSIVVGVSSR